MNHSTDTAQQLGCAVTVRTCFTAPLLRVADMYMYVKRLHASCGTRAVMRQAMLCMLHAGHLSHVHAADRLYVRCGGV